MIVNNSTITLTTSGDTDIIDITSSIGSEIQRSGIRQGAAIVFIPGSTAALTTIEFESGVINDLRRAIERLVPKDISYEHDKRWGDGNGYSHVRAALLGPSLHIPVIEGKMALGRWQQIVLLDFDKCPRQRRILVQVMGH